ncbi:MAG TPA: ASCH domain-containing protein [Planctomycetaceae bacterium]|nr:ASCH domain-containing protein [Planctomycetaceae bacterium]|tara:strand:+ start:753 stop:1181 length:429 start_codon:yes stop_codon:yes gene_type:complete
MPVTSEEAKSRYPEAKTFKFGDNRALCGRLLSLVRLGKKKATCGALRDFKNGTESMPVIGRRDIALDWDGTPALVIETTELTIRRFCDVDTEFALAEGEDETLEGWQAGHRAFFGRNGGWQSDMELVCERFCLIEDFAQSSH